MRYKILIMFIALIIPIKVFALENIIIECKNKNCDLYVNAEYEISGLEIIYETKEDLLEDVKISSEWQGGNENNIIALYTDTNKLGKVKVGSFTFKENVKKDVLNITSLKIYDEKFEEHVIKMKNNKINNKTNYKKYVIIIIGIIAVILIIWKVRKSCEKE